MLIGVPTKGDTPVRSAGMSGLSEYLPNMLIGVPTKEDNHSFIAIASMSGFWLHMNLTCMSAGILQPSSLPYTIGLPVRRSSLVPRFPFRIKDQQPESCGYPGFSLTCKELYIFGNATVLDLPLSGEFLVREIDYDKQEIQLQDPNLCLPKRLLNLNLLDSPFKSVYYQNYTFLNCTYQIIDESISKHIIHCFSRSTINGFVLATTSMTPVRAFHRYCKVIKTVSVPVPVPIQFSVGDEPAYLGDDYYGSNLTLSWDEPDCRYCEAQNQECGFRNKSSHETRCFRKKRLTPRTHLTEGAVWGISMGIGFPALLGIIYCVVICIKVFSEDDAHQPSNVELSNATLPQPVIPLISLNDFMIDSYQKIVLGESRRLPKPDDNTCPICLSEYLPKETLMIIPECNHNFHADCVDQWLRTNMTCPVCRNSST